MSSSSTEPAPAWPETPAISIVVVCRGGESLLAHCLDALRRDTAPYAAETIVVVSRHAAAAAKARVSAAHPGVCWVEAPNGHTVPRLRSLGIAHSRARVVALLEDDCEVQAGWCAAVLAAHGDGTSAVGGAVEPGAYPHARDWAVYFCDYGRFMCPPRDRTPGALPGNNVSFTTAALALLPDALRAAFVDAPVAEAWQRAGVPLRLDPAIVVRPLRRRTSADLTVLPYHHGRAYGAARVSGRPWWQRLVMGLAAAGLPALKTARVIGESVSRRRLRSQLVRALPLVLVWNTSWSWGECLGYVAGPGESPSRWQ